MFAPALLRTGLADDVLTEFQSRYYSLTRERPGAAASLDYRLSPTSEIVLTGAWTEHEDEEGRERPSVPESNIPASPSPRP